MKEKKSSAIIISISSDIGYALAQRWKACGVQVYGTYRTRSAQVDALNASGIQTFYCDLNDTLSVKKACADLKETCAHWDHLVLCPGSQEPVGSFMGCNFGEWESSVISNFVRQLQIVHELLPIRHQGAPPLPTVLFFAGGGTNNATVNYSAYTISKIALTKMCELLAAEVLDTNFTILGPGWVKTKIHEATLKAGDKAGANYQKTIEKLASQECTPMEKVLDCCDWIIQADRKAVSGRNFSVVFDKWGTPELAAKLCEDPNMYKLRRYGNSWPTKIK